MFVFGEVPPSSRRVGIRAAVALIVITGVLTSASLWAANARSAPAAELPIIPESCTPGTVRAFSVSGGPVDPRTFLDAVLKEDARACGFLTAHDADRNPPPTSTAVKTEARTINAGVQAAICPDPSSCLDPRYSTETDVATIRQALAELGYPDAEIRLAEYVGESPNATWSSALRCTRRLAASCHSRTWAKAWRRSVPPGPCETAIAYARRLDRKASDPPLTHWRITARARASFAPSKSRGQAVRL
ncbi:hypothetical protein ACQP2F_11985 [Actinoplanes sp. CA-030573]|uniref:hypothetical protein n=1 Tax=Actinoplanes sp. CA-030573 TaxID=3239898 RepID=UPI003D921433